MTNFHSLRLRSPSHGGEGLWTGVFAVLRKEILQIPIVNFL